MIHNDQKCGLCPSKEACDLEENKGFALRQILNNSGSHMLPAKVREGSKANGCTWMGSKGDLNRELEWEVIHQSGQNTGEKST